jgi:hypothetical protein
MSIAKGSIGGTNDGGLIVGGIALLPPLALLFIWLVGGVLRSGDNPYKMGA